MAASGARGGHPLTVISATLFVGVQALATAVAGGWAVGGLLNLGNVGEYGLMVIFALPALYGTMRYARSAARAESALTH